MQTVNRKALTALEAYAYSGLELRARKAAIRTPDHCSSFRRPPYRYIVVNETTTAKIPKIVPAELASIIP
jgi:hypothetical protein